MKLKMKKIVNHIYVVLVDLRNAVNKKKTPKNENTDKVIDIVEKIVKVACVVKIKLFFYGPILL